VLGDLLCLRNASLSPHAANHKVLQCPVLCRFTSFPSTSRFFGYSVAIFPATAGINTLHTKTTATALILYSDFCHTFRSHILKSYESRWHRQQPWRHYLPLHRAEQESRYKQLNNMRMIRECQCKKTQVDSTSM
jgi:hypothetical protein